MKDIEIARKANVKKISETEAEHRIAYEVSISKLEVLDEK